MLDFGGNCTEDHLSMSMHKTYKSRLLVAWCSAVYSCTCVHVHKLHGMSDWHNSIHAAAAARSEHSAQGSLSCISLRCRRVARGGGHKWMSPSQSRNIFFWQVAIHGCALQVRLLFPRPTVPKCRIAESREELFLSIAVTLRCMDETADGFLVLTRRRFFNQAGRRPSTGLLLTDWTVFDRAMFTPSTAVLLLTICLPIVWFQADRLTGYWATLT